jgi:transposase
VSEVSERLGVSAHSLYKWLKQARGNNGRHGKDHAEALQKENLRLKNELKRVEEERDILKKAAAYFVKTSG